MRQRRADHGVPRPRMGFTVVEVIVALVLVTIGLLGVAGNGALAVRVVGSSSRERRAVQRAADRVAVLTSQGCAAARGGTLVDAAAFSERWAVAAVGNGVALVDAEVRWATPSGNRSVVLRDAILC